jgi:hypothetical protein
MHVPPAATHAHVETTERLSLNEWAEAARLDLARLHPIVPRFQYDADEARGLHRAAIHVRLPADQKLRDTLLAALDCLATKVTGRLTFT